MSRSRRQKIKAAKKLQQERRQVNQRAALQRRLDGWTRWDEAESEPDAEGVGASSAPIAATGKPSVSVVDAEDEAKPSLAVDDGGREEPSLLVSIKEAARLLQISRATLDRLGSDVPGRVKLRGQVRFIRAELEGWVRRGCPALSKSEQD